MPPEPTIDRRIGNALAYAVLVGAPAVGVFVVLRVGSALPAPQGALVPASVAASGLAASDVVLRLGNFLAQIIVILALSRVIGRLLGRIGQPFVVGEMLSGILLGPSALGAVWPAAYTLLFPVGTVRFLGAVSQLGLVLFMFFVGLELDPNQLRGRGRSALLVSHTSIVMPLFLGTTLSLLLFSPLSPSGVPFPPFALFVGAAMSVTAFPVLARLLAERNLLPTTLGALALACAAVDDVSAWCVLALVVAVAHAGQGPTEVLLMLTGSAAFVAAMFLVVRPRLQQLAARHQADGHITHDVLAIIVMVALGSAWITQQLGTHALFGAFLAGVVMPKSEGFVRDVGRPFEDVLLVVLLPLFFATTGIRMSLSVISGGIMWMNFALLLLVAVAGKLGGSAVAARASGLSWRESLSLGALMNARGLIGLVILSVGLETGVISQPLYVMMVLVSIITTVMTTPMLSLFAGPTRGREMA